MTQVSHPPIRLLLVDQDPQALDALSEILSTVRDANFECEWAGELGTALERISYGGIDVVLLDLHLPDSQGLATFERAFAFAPNVPIVVFSDEENPDAAVSSVQGGAQDFLVKGLVNEQLLVRSVRYAIERHRLLSALRSLSLIDDLTGLYNRRGFSNLGEQHLKLSRRASRAVTLVYLDIDRFKTINDAFGHHFGDRGLVKIAEILRSTFRGSDIIARLGGDEFAVLALDASGEDAETLVDRLRVKLREFNLDGKEPFTLSVSVGIARAPEIGKASLDLMLQQADVAMYEEKRTKRAGATL